MVICVLFALHSSFFFLLGFVLFCFCTESVNESKHEYFVQGNDNSFSAFVIGERGRGGVGLLNHLTSVI